MSRFATLLQKTGQTRIDVRLMDIVALLYALHRAGADDDIGFEDAGRTLEGITRVLNRRVALESSVLESALWSCNLLDEKGQFWHPEGLEFERWVKDIIGRNLKYNRVYNLIERKDG